MRTTGLVTLVALGLLGLDLWPWPCATRAALWTRWSVSRTCSVFAAARGGSLPATFFFSFCFVLGWGGIYLKKRVGSCVCRSIHNLLFFFFFLFLFLLPFYLFSFFLFLFSFFFFLFSFLSFFLFIFFPFFFFLFPFSFSFPFLSFPFLLFLFFFFPPSFSFPFLFSFFPFSHLFPFSLPFLLYIHVCRVFTEALETKSDERALKKETKEKRKKRPEK